MAIADQQAICNRALQMIGAQAMDDFSDNTVEAKWCTENYATLLEEVLTTRCWRFSLSRLMLTSNGSDAWSKDYTFAVDYSTVAMVWHVWPTADKSGTVDWERVGQEIVSSKEGPLYAEVCSRNVDEGLFPPLFTQALEARIAAGAALGVARSRGLFDDMMTLYQVRLAEASAINSREASSTELDATRLTGVRGNYGLGLAL